MDRQPKVLAGFWRRPCNQVGADPERQHWGHEVALQGRRWELNSRHASMDLQVMSLRTPTWRQEQSPCLGTAGGRGDGHHPGHLHSHLPRAAGSGAPDLPLPQPQTAYGKHDLVFLPCYYISPPAAHGDPAPRPLWESALRLESERQSEEGAASSDRQEHLVAGWEGRKGYRHCSDPTSTSPAREHQAFGRGCLLSLGGKSLHREEMSGLRK